MKKPHPYYVKICQPERSIVTTLVTQSTTIAQLLKQEGIWISSLGAHYTLNGIIATADARLQPRAGTNVAMLIVRPYAACTPEDEARVKIERLEHDNTQLRWELDLLRGNVR